MTVIKFLQKEGVFNLVALAKKAGIPYQLLQRHIKDGSRQLSDKDQQKLGKVMTKYGYKNEA